MSSKRCPRCREIKPLSEFCRNRSKRDGYGSYCKPCHNIIGAENRRRRHGSTRNFWLGRRYGLDATQVEWLRLQQGGVCAICRVGEAAHVDHDHGGGRIRGILCFNCNRGLGKFGDDAGLMLEAVDYLERAATR